MDYGEFVGRLLGLKENIGEDQVPSGSDNQLLQRDPGICQ
jgi:hypothetical protein